MSRTTSFLRVPICCRSSLYGMRQPWLRFSSRKPALCMLVRCAALSQLQASWRSTTFLICSLLRSLPDTLLGHQDECLRSNLQLVTMCRTIVTFLSRHLDAWLNRQHGLFCNARLGIEFKSPRGDSPLGFGKHLRAAPVRENKMGGTRGPSAIGTPFIMFARILATPTPGSNALHAMRAVSWVNAASA